MVSKTTETEEEEWREIEEELNLIFCTIGEVKYQLESNPWTRILVEVNLLLKGDD